MSTTTSPTDIQQWTETLGSKSDENKIKALNEAIGAVARGVDLRQLVPSVAKVARANNLELVSLAYLFLTYVGRKDPQGLLLAINALEIGATQGSTPMIREQAIRTLGEICSPDIISSVASFIKKAAKDENAFVRSAVAVCIFNIAKLDLQATTKAGLIGALEEMLNDKSVDVAFVAFRCLFDIDKDKLVFNQCTDLLRKVSDASSWNVLALLEVIEAWDIVGVDDAKIVIECLFLLVQHADVSIVISSLRVLFKTVAILQDKKLRDGMVNKLILIIITATLSNSVELRYVILSSLPVLIQQYPDLFNAHVSYFVPCYTDNKLIRMCKIDILYYFSNNTNAKEVIVGLGNWVLDEVSPEIIRKCIETFGKIAIKLCLFVERILNVLKSIILALLGESLSKRSNILIDSFDKELFSAFHGELATKRVPGDGVSDLDGLFISLFVQAVIEETVIQLSTLLIFYPISVTDVLPFFEPILYLVKTERGIEASLSIFHYYKPNRINTMELFVTSLAKSSNLNRYSPTLRLMLLQLLLQRYFHLLKERANAKDDGDFTSTASDDMLRNIATILTDVFAKLMVRDSEPIMQMHVGFYYNIFITLRQGSQADVQTSNLNTILSSMEPLLEHDISALFNNKEPEIILHDPVSSTHSPTVAPTAQQLKDKQLANIKAHCIANCSTILKCVGSDGLVKN